MRTTVEYAPSNDIEVQLNGIAEATAKRLIGPDRSEHQYADIARIVRDAINHGILHWSAIKSGEVSHALLSHDDLLAIVERYNAMGGNRDIINLVSDIKQLWREKESDNKLLQSITMAMGKMPGAQQ